MFNDDIQGTAATVLAGLYGALKVQGLGPEALKDQRFVVCGAGSAGAGVIITIRDAIMARHGMSKEEAGELFNIVDADGLISKARRNLGELEELFEGLTSFAKSDTGLEGQSLLETVKSVKPTILIGLSGVGGLFSEDVLTAMGAGTDMPVIFPLSNPTSRAECTAADAQRCTGGRAIFASGSPYPDVEVDGKMVASSQCNNRYIFPGLALGAALGQTGQVTDRMVSRSAEALVELLSEEQLARRATFPDTEIREIGVHLAARVFQQAVEDKSSMHMNKEMYEHYEHGGFEELKSYIRAKMWLPNYRPLVHKD